MILIDLQQVMISNLYMQLKNHTNAELDENMIRHMVLNSIRAYNVRFSKEYGEIVIACDAKNTWRKQVFPYYKIRRKQTRDKSEMDWNTIYSAFDSIKAELKEYFPYRVIEVDGAEADDVIGTLCNKFGTEFPLNIAQFPPILIISGDKDFKQLLKYSNVRIYDPVRKGDLVKVTRPEEFLSDLIFRGDVGDDVPNVLSPDDTFAEGKRQKVLNAPRLEYLKTTPMTEWNDEVRRNWHRNKMLIDLHETPEDIQKSILDKYEEQDGKGRNRMFNYFIEYRLVNLLEAIKEF